MPLHAAAIEIPGSEAGFSKKRKAIFTVASGSNIGQVQESPGEISHMI